MKDLQLSKNFSLAEMCVTHVGIANEPNQEEINELSSLVKNVLQPLRDLYGRPIKINSGFRSFAVNKAIGGAATSQHCKGQAADLSCEDNAKLFHLINEHYVFDQLIWEGGNHIQPSWVHVSYKTTGNRNEKLKMVKVAGKSTYQRI